MKNNKLFLRLVALVFVSSMLNFAVANNSIGKDKEKKNKKNSLSNQKTINSLGLTWKEIGPDDLGGRTRALLFDKNTPTTLYAGAVGGGLWKSNFNGTSWNRVTSISDNMVVSCIAQGSNGYIYVGTGEGLAMHTGNANGSTGFIGGGIYRSTDGINFTLLTATIPGTANNINSTWAFVNDITVDASNKIFAATNKGLMMSLDNGDTWINVKNTNNVSLTSNSTDVSTAPDGTVIASVGTNCYISSNGADGSFANVSSNGLPNTGIGRAEFAIAPSNSNYLYASLSDSVTGKLKGIYRSIDKGATWTVIGPGNSTLFQPFGNFGTSPNFTGNGSYSNTLKVFPNNPDKILLGGTNLWVWQNGGNWQQRTSPETLIPMNHHTYVFHPTDPNIVLIGTDGGIYESLDGCNASFIPLNTKYNTMQFVSVAPTNSKIVIGGTQNSGNLMLNGLDTMPPVQMPGITLSLNLLDNNNAGGYTCVSKINKDAYFISDVYGAAKRTPDANAFSSFLPAKITTGLVSNVANASYIAPMILWESINDQNSTENIQYIAPDTILAGTTIELASSNYSYPFHYTTPTTILMDDTIQIRDIVQTKLFLGTKDAVWMTKKALDFTTTTPQWFKIGAISGLPQSMAYSSDGNYLFVGTSAGNLYRISNLLQSIDSLNTDITSPFSVIEKSLLTGLSASGRAITSITVDPSDPTKVLVTLGGYGNTNYIYQTVNALDEFPTFVAKQGDLPLMPVYSSIHIANNANTVLLGTEKGVYSTSNIDSANPTWAFESSPEMGNTPVYMLTQQVNNFNSVVPGTSNWGYIYAATHGRGIFQCDKYYVNLTDINEISPSIVANNINIFPNPASNQTNIKFELKQNSNVIVNILGIDGRIVKNILNKKLQNGVNQISIDCNDLSVGTYFVQLISNENVSCSKFVVIK
ncbi:MAG: T9SS type A sorting domain-containing protein [Bacteroidetes bacterium]|nr:T9SS type A sorting domain-containing protein [Bacteroidota bacterium]